MAGRLNRNKVIRKIHFFASILIFMLALFFIVSGFILSKHEWFPLGKATVTTNTYVLNFSSDTSCLENFGNEIKQQLKLSGRLEYSRNWKNEIKFWISRPGFNYDITVHQELDSLTIKKNERKTFGEINKRLHRAHGFSGGWKYILWAMLVDLTALSFIIFSITGIMIWYHSRKALKWGWVIIIPTVTLAVVVFFYLL